MTLFDQVDLGSEVGEFSFVVRKRFVSADVWIGADAVPLVAKSDLDGAVIGDATPWGAVLSHLLHTSALHALARGLAYTQAPNDLGPVPQDLSDCDVRDFRGSDRFTIRHTVEGAL